MNKFEELLPLVWFFKLHPDWFCQVSTAHRQLNDTVSYSTELWEDICLFLTAKLPAHKDDPVWDEVLVQKQTLKHFSRLKQLGFFNPKAP